MDYLLIALVGILTLPSSATAPPPADHVGVGGEAATKPLACVDPPFSRHALCEALCTKKSESTDVAMESRTKTTFQTEAMIEPLLLAPLQKARDAVLKKNQIVPTDAELAKIEKKFQEDLPKIYAAQQKRIEWARKKIPELQKRKAELEKEAQTIDAGLQATSWGTVVPPGSKGPAGVKQCRETASSLGLQIQSLEDEIANAKVWAARKAKFFARLDPKAKFPKETEIEPRDLQNWLLTKPIRLAGMIGRKNFKVALRENPAQTFSLIEQAKSTFLDRVEISSPDGPLVACDKAGQTVGYASAERQDYPAPVTDPELDSSEYFEKVRSTLLELNPRTETATMELTQKLMRAQVEELKKNLDGKAAKEFKEMPGRLAEVFATEALGHLQRLRDGVQMDDAGNVLGFNRYRGYSMDDEADLARVQKEIAADSPFVDNHIPALRQLYLQDQAVFPRPAPEEGAETTDPVADFIEELRPQAVTSCEG